MNNVHLDPARLSLLLNELRLPATKVIWQQFAEQADKEGWPAARFLAALAEHELAERDRRRIERPLAEARLLPGKTLGTFEFDAVPMISKAQVMAIVAGDTWLDKGANVLLFGPRCIGRYDAQGHEIGEPITSMLHPCSTPSRRDLEAPRPAPAAVRRPASTAPRHGAGAP